MSVADIIVSGFRKCGFHMVLFFYMAGLSMQFPIYQNMIIRRLCQERYGADICDNLARHPEAESKVQIASSRLLTLQSVFSDIPGAVMSLLLGALSDRIGRRRILLVTCSGSFLLGLTMILQSIIPVIRLPLVILSCLTFGVSGGIQTFISTALNIITDTAPEDKRAERISRTMPLIGLGIIVGMLSSGVLPHLLSTVSVYILFASSQFIVVVIVYLFIDETLPSASRIKEDGASSSGGVKGLLRLVWNSLTAGVKVLTSEENRPVRLPLLVLLVAGMIGSGTVVVELNLVMLYTKRVPFVWSPKMYGFYAASKNLMGIVGQAVGTSIVLELLGERSLRNDFRLLQFGPFSAVIVGLLTAAASSTRWMFFAALFVMFGAPARSANGSIVSRIISPSQKGAFTALGSFLNTLATPLLGLLYNGIYASSVETHPGLVFVCMASVNAVIFAAIRYVIAATPASEKAE